MTDCKIVKRVNHTTHSWSSAGKVVKPARSWYGVCPHCGEYVKGKSNGYHINYSGTNTRKTAKDALYFHIKWKHPK